nr:MAG TPA: hypothetical protein [Caudoviricetes sp.]
MILLRLYSIYYTTTLKDIKVYIKEDIYLFIRKKFPSSRNKCSSVVSALEMLV